MSTSTKPAQNERAVVSHVLVSAAFLAVGAALFTLSLALLAFPGSIGGLLEYGRLRPAAELVTMIGWLVPSFVGGAYYVLPRLNGVRLWGAELARLGLAVVAAVTVVGTVLILIGRGDGVAPFGLPWWLDIPLLIGLSIPLVVGMQTVRRRTETGVYVTLWFLTAGLAALPLLYLTATIPNLLAVGVALQGVIFSAGFSTLWVTMMGVGLAYYSTVKTLGEPLANRQLARVGFWSLVFAGIWGGPLQLIHGPIPEWLGVIAAVLSLALPVAALANAAGLAGSIGPGWARLRREPVVLAVAGGIVMALLTALATALAGFSSAAALIGLTPYWDGVTFAVLFGVGSLFSAGWIHQALPAVTGRRLASPDLAGRHVRLTLWGVGGTAALLMIAGIMMGYGWTGGAFTQLTATAENWEVVAGSAQPLIGLAVLTALVGLAGQLSLVLAVYRTVTSGEVIEQEVLMETTS